MENKRFTNIHSHIFTSKEVPDYFLRTIIGNDFIARNLNTLLQKDFTLAAMRPILWLLKITSPNYRNAIERYIEFIQIGASATQREIFRKQAQAYTGMGNYRIVVLTQILDYLDYGATSNHKRIQTQVEEVVELKRDASYQQRLYPFLALDPRLEGKNLLEWVKKYINKNMGFYGIKIYPAYGFFPFDKRLEPVWDWAQTNEVPVMTHCTRGGSWYIGSFESILNRGGFVPESINDDCDEMKIIRERIRKLTSDKPIQKNNKIWCNIFGYVDNYVPVLKKYPGLKICFAHLGGADEIMRKDDPKKYPEYMRDNWYTMILDIMKKYDNIYSDISYTLSNDTAMKEITALCKTDTVLPDRLMYGTDFFLTQQEEKGDESSLLNLFLHSFNETQIRKLAYDNTDKYLISKIHPDG